MSLQSIAPRRLRSALLGAWLGSVALGAIAAPERIALVLANSDYDNLPATPACEPSLTQVSEALRVLGYQVLQREDATSGGIAASMGELQRALEGAPGASAIVYFCGRAAAMDQRLFLLPVSANLLRPSDARTQGILAKALLDLLKRGDTSRALALIDLDSTEPVSQDALDSLAQTEMLDGTGLMVAVGSLAAGAASPLATALAEGIAVADVHTTPLLTELETRLAHADGTKVGAAHLPRRSLALAEVDPPTPVAPPGPSPVPEPRVVAQPQPQLEPVAAPAPPGPSLPDEPAMTPGQRRMVQIELARFGYYAGRIDGVFGPETRAAIRRYQGETGAEVTGVITGEQATRLLGTP